MIEMGCIHPDTCLSFPRFYPSISMTNAVRANHATRTEKDDCRTNAHLCFMAYIFVSSWTRLSRKEGRVPASLHERSQNSWTGVDARIAYVRSWAKTWEDSRKRSSFNCSKHDASTSMQDAFRGICNWVCVTRRACGTSGGLHFTYVELLNCWCLTTSNASEWACHTHTARASCDMQLRCPVRLFGEYTGFSYGDIVPCGWWAYVVGATKRYQASSLTPNWGNDGSLRNDQTIYMYVQ